MDTFAPWKNPNGTYNGVEMLAAVSGLSPKEVRWMADRLKHLLHVEKRSKDEAKAIVKAEAKSKPWEA
jgi:phage I-like protein